MARRSSFGFLRAFNTVAGSAIVLSAALVTACSSATSSLPDGNDDATTDGAPSVSSSANGNGSGGTGGTSSTVSQNGTPNAEAGTPARGQAVTCSGKAGAKGDKTITLGETKVFLHVPANVDPSKGAMLVLNFHGFLSDGNQQQLVTGMNKEADAKGFIVAYPSSKDMSWNAGECCGDARKTNRDDVGMVRTLLAELDKDYCVDKSRTFAAGFSNGGFLANKLACEMSETFAAIGVASGSLGMQDAACTPKRPIPYFHSHGTADQIVPYNGGKPTIGGDLLKGIVDGVAGTFRPVEQTVGFWKNNDKCAPESATVVEKDDTKCVVWDKCGSGAAVELCTITDMGHNWPGGFPNPFGGKQSNTISVTPMMIEFFEKHPL